MDDGRHQAQVTPGRQVYADEGHAHAIQLVADGVDPVVGEDRGVGQPVIVGQQRVHGVVEGLLDESGEQGYLLLDLGQISFETFFVMTHRWLLPLAQEHGLGRGAGGVPAPDR
jgi:hypothetical protein